MALANYVKFQRGSPEAYTARRQAGLLSEDTLYFIYDNDQTGQLYLGTRLITGIGPDADANSLAGLTDILLTNVQAGDYLVADSAGVFINKSAEELSKFIFSQLTTDNKDLYYDLDDGQLGIVGFKDAETGAYPYKGEDGAMEWDANLRPDISALQAVASSLDNTIKTAIEEAPLKVQAIANLSQVNGNNKLFIKKDANNDYYNPYIAIGSVGDLQTILLAPPDYATMGELHAVGSDLDARLTELKNRVIGDMSELELDDGEDSTTVVNEFKKINKRLTWQAFVQ